MLKFKIDPETLDVQIETNDRGAWEEVVCPELEGAAQSFTGYGGENVLTFHVSGMQNWAVSLLVVHNSVDNFIRYVEGKVSVAHDDDVLGATLTRLVNMVGAPDPLAA